MPHAQAASNSGTRSPTLWNGYVASVVFSSVLCNHWILALAVAKLWTSQSTSLIYLLCKPPWLTRNCCKPTELHSGDNPPSGDNPHLGSTSSSKDSSSEYVASSMCRANRCKLTELHSGNNPSPFDLNEFPELKKFLDTEAAQEAAATPTESSKPNPNSPSHDHHHEHAAA